jgi:hypothetical protein
MDRGQAPPVDGRMPAERLGYSRCMKLGRILESQAGIPMRIHGNYLCEVAEKLASRELAADDGDDEQDEEDEDEKRRHDDEEEEDEDEEDAVWTSPQRQWPRVE